MMKALFRIKTNSVIFTHHDIQWFEVSVKDKLNQIGKDQISLWILFFIKLNTNHICTSNTDKTMVSHVMLLCCLVLASLFAIVESTEKARFVTVSGFRLESQSIASFSVPNKLMCTRACRTNPNCKSINFNVIDDTRIECEIHSLSYNETVILREDEHSEFSCKKLCFVFLFM